MQGLLLIALAAVLAVPASANVVMTGTKALLTPNDTVLLLIDHQPFQFADLHSSEPTMVQNNVIGLAKTAKLFNIPTLLTSVLAPRGGLIIPGITRVFPNQTVIDRTYINCWEDSRVVDFVKSTGRKKLIMAALWTEVCLALPVISALGDGYEVYIVTDASGGKSKAAHEMGIARMLQAGAVPVTFFSVLFELQRDWKRDTQAGVLEICKKHGGGSGIAYLWEVQLLNNNPKRTDNGSKS